MANSSFETFKEGGKAMDEAAEKTGQQAGTVYEQAKSKASDAYDSAAGYAEDAVAKAGDAAVGALESAQEMDVMVSEQIGRHPKAVVALSIGIGFALGFLVAASRGSREPTWRDYANRWRD